MRHIVSLSALFLATLPVTAAHAQQCALQDPHDYSQVPSADDVHPDTPSWVIPYLRHLARNSQITGTQQGAVFSSDDFQVLGHNWIPFDAAKTQFLAQWCETSMLPTNCEDLTPDQHKRFQAAWTTHRAHKISSIAGPDLQRADLCYARFNETTLINANLQDAALTSVHFDDVQAEGANFNNAKLFGANFSGTNLSMASFINANLEWAMFLSGNLDLSNMQTAKLTGTAFLGASAIGADFSGADLAGTYIAHVNSNTARFDDTNLSGAAFHSSEFSHASFVNAQLIGALIMGGDEAAYTGTNFEGANFLGAAFKDVDISQAVISSAQLRTAFGDATVTRPKGMPLPCHWMQTHTFAEEYFHWNPLYPFARPYDHEPFLGRWRGWVEANGASWPPSAKFLSFARVIPIAPPPECPLIKDM